jgi:hypothetical protein
LVKCRDHSTLFTSTTRGRSPCCRISQVRFHWSSCVCFQLCISVRPISHQRNSPDLLQVDISSHRVSLQFLPRLSSWSRQLTQFSTIFLVSNYDSSDVKLSSPTLSSSVGPKAHRSRLHWRTASNCHLVQFDCNFVHRIRNILCSPHGLAPVLPPDFYRSGRSCSSRFGRRWSVLVDMSLSLSSITYGHLQGKLPLNGGRGNSWVVSACRTIGMASLIRLCLVAASL